MRDHLATGDITLAQLRVFWAVANAETLTKAAKQLGLTQPSVSQQLANLEQTLGVRLFDRTPSGMKLTDGGRFLLRRAEAILGGIEETKAELREFAASPEAHLRIAGLNSVLRALLPHALSHVARELPTLNVEIQETGPAEAMELLHARRVDVAVVASTSVAGSGAGIARNMVAQDPNVLAVPAGLDLAGLADPADLPAEARRVLHTAIEFNFGTAHARQVEHWYARVLPGSRVLARCGSYEVALGLVQAGLGVCLVPAFAARTEEGPLPGVTLYATDLPGRELVAASPSQYARLTAHRSLVQGLQHAGRVIRLPSIEPLPPFLQPVPAVAD